MSDRIDGDNPHAAMGAGREFDAIRGLIARWGPVARGIGDDAASIDVPRGDQLVVSVDSCVAGRHFQPEWITPREIGYRAAVAALSDLAAMAALPLGVLLAINLPDDWTDRAPEIADGVADAARKSRTVIVGGNISAATELSITTTVLGHAYRPLKRAGAVVGDLLYVTGRLGGPGRAIAAWTSGRTPSAVEHDRFAWPAARIREARWLAERGATACIDISDGIVADAGHLAAASRMQIELHCDRLPVIDGATPADAATSGEEYELLVTAPALDAAAFTAAFGIPLTIVGLVARAGSDVMVFDGDVRVATAHGHDHFSS